MLTMLLIRPGHVLAHVVLLGLADLVRLEVRRAGRVERDHDAALQIGCGAYGASVAGPGLGTARAREAAAEEREHAPRRKLPRRSTASPYRMVWLFMKVGPSRCMQRIYH